MLIRFPLELTNERPRRGRFWSDVGSFLLFVALILALIVCFALLDTAPCQCAPDCPQQCESWP